ncbi:MAG: tetratricopeptide repeat protein [Acidobacteria bacterium]|nr:tetratricopeptide repeat protein [Acidobacteriota bacterium]
MLTSASIAWKAAIGIAVAGRGTAARLAVSVLVALCAFCLSHVVSANVDDKSALKTDYSALVAKSYDYRFGSNPFAPSNATSSTGTFIPGDKFVSAARCAVCHTDAHAQWRQSAHGNAFREPFYQKNVKDIISQKDIAFTRHCESCHNPAALFTGALTGKPAFKNRPFDEEGVSCIACHSIQSVNRRGIGGYVMGEPALLVREDGTRLNEGVTDQQILDDVPDHRRAMMRAVLKQPEFCGACHKSQVPKELNDYKFLRAFAVADELQMSSFSKESPHPFYVRDRETCNSCHMKPEAAPKFDVSAKDGVIKSHRWAAANTAIPFFYKYDEQLDAVRKFLEADALGVDIFAVRRQARDDDREELIAPLNRSGFKINKGDEITADVVITNKNMGHSFPPELRDFYEAYVEFTVADAATGKSIFSSGFIKPDGFLDESAHTYKTYLVMGDGSFNDRHHIWKTRVIAQNNQIQSGRSDMARYHFRIPESAGDSVKLTARVRYRRFTRVFQDYALGKRYDYPIVTMATNEYTMRVGENAVIAPPPAGTKGVVPDWRRWNNYGIALFDNRQYALAVEAFARVAGLDETYKPMALVNRALALIELDRWDEASRLVDAALEINPNLHRALFQRARIRIRRGQLQEAEADIRRVLEAFPRDRLSLQQLGELSKIKRDFATARDAYERILQIDPEDAGSHYNLMLVYRKLGMPQEARAEAKIFADLKDDPGALPIASEFLRRHPEMKGESVPWHVHEMARAREEAGYSDK